MMSPMSTDTGSDDAGGTAEADDDHGTPEQAVVTFIEFLRSGRYPDAREMLHITLLDRFVQIPLDSLDFEFLDRPGWGLPETPAPVEDGAAVVEFVHTTGGVVDETYPVAVVDTPDGWKILDIGRE